MTKQPGDTRRDSSDPSPARIHAMATRLRLDRKTLRKEPRGTLKHVEPDPMTVPEIEWIGNDEDGEAEQ